MLSREEQDLQIQIAMACAAAGDPWEMVTRLHRANILAGIKLTFARKWPRFSPDDVDELVSIGVDALFDKVSRGDTVANPVGYILEVMRHKAHDRVEENKNLVPLDADRDVGEPSPDTFADLSDDRLESALETARALIPRLGQASVQDVMVKIFDAVEDGRSHLTTLELARATGLAEDTVRQCRSRGFRRLERIVRLEGLTPNLSGIHVHESSEINTRNAEEA